MNLLPILIKERNLKWQKIIVETAEAFTAMNALQSSGFRLTLGGSISEELEERSSLFLAHSDDIEDLSAFGKFFEDEEKSLRASILARFGIEVPGKDSCEIIRKKYEATLSSRPQQKTKKVIGFHT
jgi:hypothetical protein